MTMTWKSRLGIAAVASAGAVALAATTGYVRACIGDISVGASSIRNCGSWALVSL